MAASFGFMIPKEMILVRLLLLTGTRYALAAAQSAAGGPTIAPFSDSMWASLSVDSQLKNQTKSIGDRVTFDCEITGYPTPRYAWFKDDQEVLVDDRTPSSKRYRIQNQDWGSRLRIDRTVVSDSGTYRCTATNPRGTVDTTASLKLRPAVPGAAATSPPAAAARPQSTIAIDQILYPNMSEEDSDDEDVNPYCQDYKGTYCPFLKDQRIYVTSRKSQHLADQRIMRMITELNSLALSNKQCYTQARAAMCHHQMPQCAEDIQQRAYPKRLCKSECEDIVTACRSEFGGNERAWRLLPNCAELSDNEGCISLGQTDQQGVKDAASRDKGLQGDVPYIIIIPCIAGGVVIIIVVTVVCVRRQRANKRKLGTGRKKPKPIEDETDSSINKDRDGKMQELLLLSRNGSSTGGSSSERAQVPYVKDVSIANIHFVEELGEGQFGKIYRSQVFGLYGNGTATMALVKTLYTPSTPTLALAFRREIDDMVDLRHQHVALLLGVSLQGAPRCALYEHLPLGDLKQFLLSHAPQGAKEERKEDDDGPEVPLYAGEAGLQMQELLYMATQVASALEYLVSVKRKHSDVAARNVLVGQNLNVKLSNLSISRGPYSADYCLLHERLMPVRWLPPEFVTYGQSSHEADAYSFGVLLWELFSFGHQPYAGHNNHEVIELIRSRHLLTCPAAAPPRLYSLMVECWHEAPAKRPTAHELHQKLRGWYVDAASAPPIMAADGTRGTKASKSSKSSSAASSASSSGAASLRGGAGGGYAMRSPSAGTDGTNTQGSRSGFEGTEPLLQPPPSSPSYVPSGSSPLPSYYTQPLPYVCSAVPSGSGFDKPLLPSEKSAPLSNGGCLSSSTNNLSQNYIETQVDFPQRHAMVTNDFV